MQGRPRRRPPSDQPAAGQSDAVREALEPVWHWYQSDEHPERPLAEIVADAVRELLREARAWLGLFEAKGYPLSGSNALMSHQTGIRDISSQDILCIRKVLARIDAALATPPAPVEQSASTSGKLSSWLETMPYGVVAQYAFNDGCREGTYKDIVTGHYGGVKLKAEMVVDMIGDLQADEITRLRGAVEAERERCARLVEKGRADGSGIEPFATESPCQYQRRWLAAAIRAQPKEN